MFGLHEALMPEVSANQRRTTRFHDFSRAYMISTDYMFSLRDLIDLFCQLR